MNFKKCVQCNAVFSYKPYRESTARFCSNACYAVYKKGLPTEARTKYGIFQKGHQGYDSSPWKGKKLTEEHKASISRAMTDNQKVINHVKILGLKKRGSNHWNWKGGITDEIARLRNSPEHKNWSRAIYKKDYWTCQHCEIKCTAGNIIAHHIKSFRDYPDLRFSVENGITLCRSCHKKLHKEIGAETQFKPINSIET